MSIFHPTRIFAVVACLPLVACAPAMRGTPSTGGTEAVRLAIQQTNAEIIQAARRHDAVAVAARYAPDAVLLLNGMEPIHGRQAIQDTYSTFLSGMEVYDAAIHPLEIVVVGDIALEMGTNNVLVQPRGQARPSRRPGKYLVVWKRQPDGSWKIWRDSPSENTADPS